MKTILNFISPIFLFFLFIACNTENKKGRIVENIDFDWHFHLGDIENGHRSDLSHKEWRKLDLPHDWSIEGEYSNDYDGKGRMGFLPGGIGWYRKDFKWDKAWKNKNVSIEFNGVHMNSKVWVNGHFLGLRPSGYTSFSYDITPYLTKNNIIAVRVDNSKLPSARWYTGSGIYRHVNLVATHKTHVVRHGVYVTTPKVKESEALIHAEIEIDNRKGAGEKATIVSVVLKDGKEVAQNSS